MGVAGPPGVDVAGGVDVPGGGLDVPGGAVVAGAVVGTEPPPPPPLLLPPHALRPNPTTQIAEMAKRLANFVSIT